MEGWQTLSMKIGHWALVNCGKYPGLGLTSQLSLQELEESGYS